MAGGPLRDTTTAALCDSGAAACHGVATRLVAAARRRAEDGMAGE